MNHCLVQILGKQNNHKEHSLPILKAFYDITIHNAIAKCHVTQVYRNNSEKFLQILYKFPISPSACIYKFTASFGDKILQSFVKQKQEAKNEYNSNIRLGNKAGLASVSQQSKDIMIINLGNIEPQQEIKIQIYYLEELKIFMNSCYQFDLQSKIYPRYFNSLKQHQIIQSYGLKTQTTSLQWNLQIKIISNNKILKCYSPTHQIQTSKTNNNQYLIILSKTKNLKLISDFTFQFYTQQFQRPTYIINQNSYTTTAMISFIPKYCELNIDDALKQSKNNFQTDISIAKGQYIFLLDRSGSMDGGKIKNAIIALNIFLKSLPIDSFFNIVSFGSIFLSLFQNSRPNNKQNIQKAITQISNMQANLGGTQIEQPLKNIFSKDIIEGYPRHLYLLTDGQVSNTQQVINIVRKNTKYCRVHSIGIGSGASRALIQGCAQKGKGQYIFISQQQNVAQKIIQLFNNSLTPVISKIQLKYDTQLVQSIVPNLKKIPYILKNQTVNFYINFKDNKYQKTKLQFLYVNPVDNQEYKSILTIYPQNNSMVQVSKMGYHKIIQALQQAQQNKQNIQDKIYYVKNIDFKKQIIQQSLKHQILSKYTAFSIKSNKIQDNIHQQFQNKGRYSIQLNHQSNYQYYQQSQQGDYYINQCAISQSRQIIDNTHFQHEFISQSKQQFQQFCQRQQLDCYKSQNKFDFEFNIKSNSHKIEQKQNSLLKIVNAQQIEGYWKQQTHLQSLKKNLSINSFKQQIQIFIAITFWIAKWIEEQQKPQYKMILNKANNWLKKQSLFIQLKDTLNKMYQNS